LIRVAHDAVSPKIDTSEEFESDLFVASIRYFLRDANFIYRALALSRTFSRTSGFRANIDHGKGTIMACLLIVPSRHLPIEAPGRGAGILPQLPTAF
jgi:hypothetical protein